MYKILITLGDWSSSTYYRNYLPWVHCREELSKHKIRIDISRYIDPSSDYDAYVFSRLPEPKYFSLVNNLYFNNKKIVWDLDDEIWNIPEGNNAFDNDKLWISMMPSYLSLASLIGVSTEPLKRSMIDALKINESKVSVLKNLVDINEYKDFSYNYKQDPKLTIMWSGSPSHVIDMEPVDTLLNHYKNDNRIRFLFFGYIPEKYKEIHQSKVIHIPWCTRKYYESIIDILKPDISLIPLKNIQFNRCKSDIKYLEMSMCKVPSIVSKTEPYAWIPTGNNHLLVDHDDMFSWIENCDTLVDSESIRRKCAVEARSLVVGSRSWQHSGHSATWLDFYRSIPDVKK